MYKRLINLYTQVNVGFNFFAYFFSLGKFILSFTSCSLMRALSCLKCAATATELPQHVIGVSNLQPVILLRENFY